LIIYNWRSKLKDVIKQCIVDGHRRDIVASMLNLQSSADSLISPIRSLHNARSFSGLHLAEAARDISAV
jgi:hypothetical protein